MTLSPEALHRLLDLAIDARDNGIPAIGLTPPVLISPTDELWHARGTIRMFEARIADINRTIGVTSPKWNDTMDGVTKAVDGQKSAALLDRVVQDAHKALDTVGAPYGGEPASRIGRAFALLPAHTLRRVGEPVTPPRPVRNGDRLDSFTAAELDALPVGAKFVHPDPLYYDFVRTACGSLTRYGDTITSADVLGNHGRRTLVLPEPAAVSLPAIGTALSDVTDAQLDALPVGSRFENAGLTRKDELAPTKCADGWWNTVRREGAADCGPLDMRGWRTNFGPAYRRVRIGEAPAEPVKPSPTPAKVGDRWGDLTAEQRAGLPVGTVVANVATDGRLSRKVRVEDGWDDGIGSPLKTIMRDNVVMHIPAGGAK